MIRIVYLSFLLGFCWLSLQGQGRQRIADALEPYVMPISSVDLNDPNGLQDLEQLSPFLADKQIIGLGEATHGTSEFFAFKASVIRYAVEHLNYRVIAFEAPFSLRAVDAYVRHGTGTLQEAVLATSFWIWQTEEVADLLAWLRGYNDTLPFAERVAFVGIDMQSLDAAAYWVELIEAQQWQLPDSLMANLTTLSQQASYRLASRPASELAFLSQEIGRFGQWVQAHKPQIALALTVEEQAFAYQYAVVLQQTLDHYLARADQQAGYVNFRDSCMAANVHWLHQSGIPGAKILLWAHNGHISQREEPMGRHKIPHRLMGYYLDRAMGDAYYSIGMGFNHGAFRASDPKGVKRQFSLGPAKKRSWGWYLAPVPHQMFFFDWQQLQGDPMLASWSQKARDYHQVGAGFYPGKQEKYWYYVSKGMPSKEFDAWFFVQQTTAAHPIQVMELSASIPEERLVGKTFRLRMYVRSADIASQTCSPQGNILSWTQHTTLAAFPTQVYPSERPGWMQLSAEGIMPSETELVHFYFRWPCVQQMQVDGVLLEVATEAGSWEAISAFQMDFEGEVDSSVFNLPDRLAATRRQQAAYQGNWGLELVVE